jgi:hypothetical protein
VVAPVSFFCHGLPLPAGATAPASKSSPTTESSEPTTTTAATAAKPSEAASSASPAATAATAATAAAKPAGRNDDRKAARAGATSPSSPSPPRVTENEEDDHEDDEDREWRNSTVAARRIIIWTAHHWRWRERGIERKVEFVRKTLGRPQSHQLQTGTVVLRLERGRRLSADVAGVPIRYESFGAATSRDEAMTPSVLARFLGHEQNHCAGVPRRIAGIPDLSNLPLAADLQRDFLDVASADVGERDDRHLAPYILGNALHALHGVGLEDVCEIVYQSRRRRDLNTLWKKEERCRPQHGKQSCRGRKTQQQCVQDLLSLDFMVREEVYLADDSPSS